MSLLEARDLVAGYLPGVDILHGADLDGRRRGDRRHHRAERRREVDVAQGDLRAWCPCVRAPWTLAGRRHHPASFARAGRARCRLRAAGAQRVHHDDRRRQPAHGRVSAAEGVPVDGATACSPCYRGSRNGSHQRAGSLSGGERQMLAMARALMMKLSVLLVDEPSAGLSPMMQDDVFERIADIGASGVSVLMVEQNARRCLEIAHRGYVLDQGRNAYQGTGNELLADPKVVELYLGTLAQRNEHGGMTRRSERTSPGPQPGARPRTRAVPATPRWRSARHLRRWSSSRRRCTATRRTRPTSVHRRRRGRPNPKHRRSRCPHRPSSNARHSA